MAATLSAGRNRIFPEGPNRVRRNSEGLSPATLFLKLNDNFSPTAAGSAEHTFRRRRLSASHDAGNKEDKPLFAKSRLSWVDGADADAEHTKAIRLLGVNVDAIDRSKCLKMMGVSEDDYQKSLDVFDMFHKIGNTKSGTVSTPKARQILGVDDVSLKLDKPFRTLGIGSDSLDRERMVSLSVMGVPPTLEAAHLLAPSESMENDAPRFWCMCSSAGHRR